MADISLTKLPWYGQVLAFLALGVAGCGVYYYYYEMPVQAVMASRRTQLKSLRAEVDELRQVLRKVLLRVVEQGEQEVWTTKGDLDAFLKRLKYTN